MRKLLALGALLTVLHAAQPSSPSGFDPTRLARIAPRMKELADRGQIPGCVTLLARHGRIAHHEAVGWQDIEVRKPMRPDSIFQIMSMTKPVTGVAIMILAEEGRLTVTDPVSTYLPEFTRMTIRDTANPDRRVPRPITIRDLMMHTSGMSGPHDEFKGLYQTMDRSLADAVAGFAKAPLEYEPGTRWMYSNTGIATLGRIVEVVSGKSFEQFVTERIFKPLGMTDSFFFVPQAKASRVAMVYTYKGGKLERAGGEILGGDPMKLRANAKYSAPEFGMYSTARDLFAFYQTMLNGGTYRGTRLLSQASVDTMTAVHTGDLRAGHLPGTGFGLTWEVVKEPVGTASLLSQGTFGHGGAFGTHGWIDRKKNLVGVFLVQRSGNEAKMFFFQLAGAAVVD